MRNLSFVVGLALLATSPAMADMSNDPRIDEMQKSTSFGSFHKAIKRGKCKFISAKKAVCNSEKAARKANRKLAGVKEVIGARFGSSMASNVYKPVLGKWANVKFRFVAQVDPCNPNPCLNGGICSNVDGKAVCEDAVVVAVADPVVKPVKPKVKPVKPKVKPVPPPAPVEEPVITDSDLCCLDCIYYEQESKTPWAAILLSQLFLVLLGLATFWWLFIRKKDDDEPTPPTSSVSEEDIAIIIEAMSSDVNQGFSERLSTPLRKFVT